jgi:hypothetical protein
MSSDTIHQWNTYDQFYLSTYNPFLKQYYTLRFVKNNHFVFHEKKNVHLSDFEKCEELSLCKRICSDSFQKWRFNDSNEIINVGDPTYKLGLNKGVNAILTKERSKLDTCHCVMVQNLNGFIVFLRKPHKSKYLSLENQCCGEPKCENLETTKTNTRIGFKRIDDEKINNDIFALQWRLEFEFTGFVHDNIEPVFKSLIRIRETVAENSNVLKNIDATNNEFITEDKNIILKNCHEINNWDEKLEQESYSIIRPSLDKDDEEYVYFGDVCYVDKTSPPQTYIAKNDKMLFKRPTRFIYTGKTKIDKGFLYWWIPYVDVQFYQQYVSLGYIVTSNNEIPKISDYPNLVCVNKHYTINVNLQQLQTINSSLWFCLHSFLTIPNIESETYPSMTIYTLSPKYIASSFKELKSQFQPSLPSSDASLSRMNSLIRISNSNILKTSSFEFLFHADNEYDVIWKNDEIAFYRVRCDRNKIRFGDGLKQNIMTCSDNDAFTFPISYSLQCKWKIDSQTIYFWKPVSNSKEYKSLGYVITLENELPSIYTVRMVHEKFLTSFNRLEKTVVHKSQSISHEKIYDPTIWCSLDLGTLYVSNKHEINSEWLYLPIMEDLYHYKIELEQLCIRMSSHIIDKLEMNLPHPVSTEDEDEQPIKYLSRTSYSTQNISNSRVSESQVGFKAIEDQELSSTQLSLKLNDISYGASSTIKSNSRDSPTTSLFETESESEFKFSKQLFPIRQASFLLRSLKTMLQTPDEFLSGELIGYFQSISNHVKQLENSYKCYVWHHITMNSRSFEHFISYIDLYWDMITCLHWIDYNESQCKEWLVPVTYFQDKQNFFSLLWKQWGIKLILALFFKVSDSIVTLNKKSPRQSEILSMEIEGFVMHSDEEKKSTVITFEDVKHIYDELCNLEISMHNYFSMTSNEILRMSIFMVYMDEFLSCIHGILARVNSMNINGLKMWIELIIHLLEDFKIINSENASIKRCRIKLDNILETIIQVCLTKTNQTIMRVFTNCLGMEIETIRQIYHKNTFELFIEGLNENIYPDISSCLYTAWKEFKDLEMPIHCMYPLLDKLCESTNEILLTFQSQMQWLLISSPKPIHSKASFSTSQREQVYYVTQRCDLSIAPYIRLINFAYNSYTSILKWIKSCVNSTSFLEEEIQVIEMQKKKIEQDWINWIYTIIDRLVKITFYNLCTAGSFTLLDICTHKWMEYSGSLKSTLLPYIDATIIACDKDIIVDKYKTFIRMALCSSMINSYWIISSSNLETMILGKQNENCFVLTQEYRTDILSLLEWFNGHARYSVLSDETLKTIYEKNTYENLLFISNSLNQMDIDTINHIIDHLKNDFTGSKLYLNQMIRALNILVTKEKPSKKLSSRYQVLSVDNLQLICIPKIFQ